MWYEIFVDNRIFPERVMRSFIRIALKKYFKKIQSLSESEIKQIQYNFQKTANNSEITIHANLANSQHYELPTSFFEKILSSHMKYSGSEWKNFQSNLETSDSETLDLYSKRAEISNNHSILELGSGWGSLCLYLAKKFPASFITTVTNSNSQKKFIEAKASSMNLNNLNVIKADISEFSTNEKFDRIVSIEMFEHTRNTKLLLQNIEEWLEDDGKLFIQVFSHQKYPQFFDDFSNSWMSKNFFTGGMMPYKNFYGDIQKKLKIVQSWEIEGIYYQKTLDSWLNNLEINKREISKQLSYELKPQNSKILTNRFRMFLLICSELFGFNSGKEWVVMNHLFEKEATQ
ncbi:MAG: SAM-dependent methyltransferase [Chloroflexi bacterium]|nr:SAM-dependent methyltransferase [Chloroflexota bacterium]|tara:strand:- start:305 stop:1339 length:1035 start_codon:yes stop_codon:yes gene_type:complete